MAGAFSAAGAGRIGGKFQQPPRLRELLGGSDGPERFHQDHSPGGKGQNQLQFAIGLATTQITNISAAESRIRDADLAQEEANLTRAAITQQAGVAALAQANSAPQAVLALLRV